jgi:adenosylcobinamide-phosphate guanylyltransferase
VSGKRPAERGSARKSEHAPSPRVGRMDALVMCGGEGSRLDATGEKPLFEVGGEPMVGRVCRALDGAAVDEVYAVTSPATPETRAHLADQGVPLVEGTGEGYVADLGAALDAVDPPVVTVVADLPLLAPEHVEAALAAHDGRNVTVCVPTRLKSALGVSAETTRRHGGVERSPTGLNVVTAGEAPERVETSWDARLAVNVNYTDDAAVAEVLAGGP